MQTVQHTKHFAHPSNWAGFLLIGGNVRLSNKVALIGQALCELVKTPEKCRDALRVCLHLVSGFFFVCTSQIEFTLSDFFFVYKGRKKFATYPSWTEECNVYNTKEH